MAPCLAAARLSGERGCGAGEPEGQEAESLQGRGAVPGGRSLLATGVDMPSRRRAATSDLRHGEVPFRSGPRGFAGRFVDGLGGFRWF